MTISEYIKRLQYLQKLHGDIDVVYIQEDVWNDPTAEHILDGNYEFVKIC